MENKRYDFSASSLWDQAMDYMRLALLNEGVGERDLMEEALASFRSHPLEGARALVSYRPANALPEEFDKEGASVGAYLFLMTVGEVEEGNSLSERFYLDLWGNAMLESGKKRLWACLKELPEYGAGGILSFVDGPGLRNVPLELLPIWFQVLEAGSLGVSLVKGSIRPAKSFAGVCRVLARTEGAGAGECRTCLGEKRNCSYCIHYQEDEMTEITGSMKKTSHAPSEEECLKMLEVYGTPPHVVRHCRAVARAAVRMGTALNDHGFNLDIQLLDAAGLLHDIARVEEAHWEKGAKIVREKGYPRVADLILPHMTYGPDHGQEEISELDVLCLADRMVQEDRYIGLKDRMRVVLEKYRENPQAYQRVRDKMMASEEQKQKIEKITGKSIDQIMEE